jgi:outer membrane protein TolC
MRGIDHQQSQMFSYLSPETRVRKDHPLRAIRLMVDEILAQLSRRFDSTLTAFQQVEDNLAALRILRHEAQQQKEATASAQESLQIFTDRYIGGADPYLQVLTVQTITLQNERNDVDILRRRMDASVLLVKALGGGWSTSQLSKISELH